MFNIIINTYYKSAEHLSIGMDTSPNPVNHGGRSQCLPGTKCRLDDQTPSSEINMFWLIWIAHWKQSIFIIWRKYKKLTRIKQQPNSNNSNNNNKQNKERKKQTKPT